MSRDKQTEIEEMAKVISTLPPVEIYGARSYGKKIFLTTHLAEHLYIHDYRKVSDIALEVIGEIEPLLDGSNYSAIEIIWNVKYLIAELKKKYTVTDTNVGCKDTEEGK